MPLKGHIIWRIRKNYLLKQVLVDAAEAVQGWINQWKVNLKIHDQISGAELTSSAVS